MKKILVPCDFSDNSKSALNYAVELSKFFSAKLALLHVDLVPVLSPEMSLTAYSFDDIKQDSLDALKNLSDKIKLTRDFNNEIEYHTEMGTTTEVIIEHAKKLNADLVVMGISGHGSSFIKNLVGSASVDVSKKMNVPLVIVPPEAEYKKIENVAYACDYEEHFASGISLAKVKKFADVFKARLNVVHVVSPGHELSPAENDINYYIERRLEGSAHSTFVVQENNAAKGMLNFIKQNNIDLIIVEPHKHSWIHNLFYGDTINQLVFYSPVPVLTIHHEE